MTLSGTKGSGIHETYFSLFAVSTHMKIIGVNL